MADSNGVPRRVSMSYILGFSSKPYKDPKPPAPSQRPPHVPLRQLLSTPGGVMEWAASDGRKGALKGQGKARSSGDKSRRASSEKGEKQPNGDSKKNDAKEKDGEDVADDDDNSNTWTEEQDKMLLEWKAENANGAWAACAELVGRKVHECKERWKQIKPADGDQNGGKNQGGGGGGNQQKQGKKEKNKNRGQNQNQGKDGDKKNDTSGDPTNAWGGGGWGASNDTNGNADTSGNDAFGGGFDIFASNDDNKDDSKNDKKDDKKDTNGADEWNTSWGNDNANGGTGNGGWDDTGTGSGNKEDKKDDKKDTKGADEWGNTGWGNDNGNGATGGGGWDDTGNASKKSGSNKGGDDPWGNPGWGNDNANGSASQKAPTHRTSSKKSASNKGDNNTATAAAPWDTPAAPAATGNDTNPPAEKAKSSSSRKSKSHHRADIAVHRAELEVRPDSTFSADDLRLVARILQQDYQMVWSRVSWRFRDKTGRTVEPDVFERKITGRVEGEEKEKEKRSRK